MSSGIQVGSPFFSGVRGMVDSSVLDTHRSTVTSYARFRRFGANINDAKRRRYDFESDVVRCRAAQQYSLEGGGTARSVKDF
jgi:hypothetical protein